MPRIVLVTRLPASARVPFTMTSRITGLLSERDRWLAHEREAA